MIGWRKAKTPRTALLAVLGLPLLVIGITQFERVFPYSKQTPTAVTVKVDTAGANDAAVAEPAPAPAVALLDPPPPLPVRKPAVRPKTPSECLAEVMYYEARGEGPEGQKAVAEVVLERMRSKEYASTVCGVVYAGAKSGRKGVCQFSFTCDGSLLRARESGAWRAVRQLAENIMAGAIDLGNRTGNAVAFHNIGVTPSWTGTMLRTAIIGHHVFYRLLPKNQLPFGYGDFAD